MRRACGNGSACWPRPARNRGCDWRRGAPEDRTPLGFEYCRDDFRRGARRLDLLKPALFRIFVGPKVDERCAMPKPLAGHLIVFDLNHELRIERNPLA